MIYDNRKIDFVTIMFFLMFITTTALVFAVETNTVNIDDTFIKGNIRYSKPCFYNNTFCSAAAACNLTVYYPNNTVLIDNQAMTNRGYEHNYTFNTNSSGIYKLDMVCLDVGYWGSETFYFEVNPTGLAITNQRSDIIGRSIWFFFGLGIAFFIAFFFAPKLPFKITLIIGSSYFFLIAINILNVSIADEILNPRLISLMDGLTAITFYLYWFLGFILCFTWLITFFNTYFGNKAQAQLARYT